MSEFESQAREEYLKRTANIGGMYLFSFSAKKTDEEDMRKLKEFEIRTDDIFVLGYPKCGTHWTWEIVNMLVQGKTEYSKRTKGAFMLEAAPLEEMDAMESPRILNSHHWFRFLPDQMLTKKPKIIFILRNPKDVCVSYFSNMRDFNEEIGFAGNFTTFLDMFLKGEVCYGSMIEYVADCEHVMANHPNLPVHVVLYEDMKQKPVEHVKQLADFIGVGADADLCSAITDACSFKNLKRASIDIKEDILKHIWEEGATGMYRKGVVGDWKNWFTVAQNEMFDRFVSEKVKASKFLSRYWK